MIRIFLTMVVAMLLVGCGPGARTYDVTVENQTGETLIVWLTKDGPPYEPAWASPEDTAVETPKKIDRIAGVVVEPGQQASTGQITGRFAEGVNAILRIYSKVADMDEILATGRGNPNRLDVPLQEGVNRLAVVRRDGRLSVIKTTPGATPEPAGR
jgi:hypothetical protein